MKRKKPKFVLSILGLLSASLLSVSCKTKEIIPDIEICAEIPFVDGPEGACAKTLTKTSRIQGPSEWAADRPLRLSIHVNEWSKIKTAWLKACRYAGPDCNVALNSVDSVIKSLDSFIKANFSIQK